MTKCRWNVENDLLSLWIRDTPFLFFSRIIWHKKIGRKPVEGSSLQYIEHILSNYINFHFIHMSGCISTSRLANEKIIFKSIIFCSHGKQILWSFHITNVGCHCKINYNSLITKIVFSGFAYFQMGFTIFFESNATFFGVIKVQLLVSKYSFSKIEKINNHVLVFFLLQVLKCKCAIITE